MEYPRPPFFRGFSLLLPALVAIILGHSARAQVTTNFFFDANGATAGIGGTGNWTTTGTSWTTNSAGTNATVSGNWVLGAAWSNNLANNAILQGTAGTVSLSSGTISANQIQVNTSGFTIQNSSTGTTSANRYFRTKNGIVLAEGVNLNVSSGVTTNGAITGFEGPIVGVNGTNSVSTGSSITVTGATANADSSVRIQLDTSASDVWVPLNINTTGNGYANLGISSSSVTANIYGNVTVSNNSRLVLGNNNSSTTRRLNVRGNLTTANTDLVIGESGFGGTIGLYGTNSIGGNVILNAGRLGYGSKEAFGTSTVVISNGTQFGQITGIGTTDADRTITNQISLQGNVALGLGSFGNYLGGNVNLNGAARTITISNSSFFFGSISNGSLVITNPSSTRTVGLNGSNSMTAVTLNGGIVSVGNANGLGTGSLTVNSSAADNTLAASNGLTLTNSVVINGGSLSLDSGSFPTDSWTYAGSLSGAGSIVKTGVGSLSLTGANTYAGSTTISNGTLVLGNASALSSGAVTVAAGVLDLNSQSLTNAITLSGGTVTNGTISTSAAFTATAGTFAAPISGTGSLSKTGSGTLTITAANTYSGGTAVSAGTLVVNNTAGSGTGSGSLTISNGATLAGSGIIGSATTIGGIHSPGNSPGIQTFTDGLTYLSGATFIWELAANAATGRGTVFDGVDVTGGLFTVNTGVTNSLVFNGAGSSVNWADNFWSSNQSWLVFSNALSPSLGSSSIFGTVEVGLDSLGADLSVSRSGSSFTWTAVDGDLYLNYSVPEPSTYALLALAAAAFGARVLRRRR